MVQVEIQTTSYNSNPLDKIWYIANRLRWKGFVVVKLNCDLEENIHGWKAEHEITLGYWPFSDYFQASKYNLIGQILLHIFNGEANIRL